MGIQSSAAELGIEFENAVNINSDASAAIFISNRIGFGNVRHIEVTQLWRQGKVRKSVIAVNKVGTDDDLSDALTKGLNATSIHRHLEGVGIETRTDRQDMAPELDSKVQIAGHEFEDE